MRQFQISNKYCAYAAWSFDNVYYIRNVCIAFQPVATTLLIQSINSKSYCLKTPLNGCETKGKLKSWPNRNDCFCFLVDLVRLLKFPSEDCCKGHAVASSLKPIPWHLLTFDGRFLIMHMNRKTDRHWEAGGIKLNTWIMATSHGDNNEQWWTRLKKKPGPMPNQLTPRLCPNQSNSDTLCGCYLCCPCECGRATRLCCQKSLNFFAATAADAAAATLAGDILVLPLWD